MGDVVNLNKFRKARDAQADAAKAAENRQRFGRTKPVKAKTRQEIEQANREFDGKRLD